MCCKQQSSDIEFSVSSILYKGRGQIDICYTGGLKDNVVLALRLTTSSSVHFGFIPIVHKDTCEQTVMFFTDENVSYILDDNVVFQAMDELDGSASINIAKRLTSPEKHWKQMQLESMGLINE